MRVLALVVLRERGLAGEERARGPAEVRLAAAAP